MGRTYYKGAPEKLLECADKMIGADGKVTVIDRQRLDDKINALAQKAMRILAFGYSEKKMLQDKVNEDIVIIGLVAIRDDVRKEAKEAIRQVQEAGVQVVMITGDRLETAVAIAKDAGLVQSDKDLVLTSAQLNEMSDAEVKKNIRSIRVIARTLPTDKSRMVKLCQEENIVVGMTGDGVNDSAALKRADVAFAMGSGTEVAKEAGDIVILDDNFKSIKDAVRYGRTIYKNILKFCRFQLVINVAAVLVSAIGPFFGIIEPLKVTHLLFVNLVMDSLGAIMLGNEPAQEKYMKEKPIKRDASIINGDMVSHIASMGLWLTVISFCFLKTPIFDALFTNKTIELHTAQKYTAFFVLFIWGALFNGFNVRDDGFAIFKDLNKNKNFMRIWVIIALVQAVIVNAALVPVNIFQWIGEMFSCTPFPMQGWIVVIVLAFTMIPVDLLRKILLRERDNGGKVKRLK
jgi:calcium-translocating P-type ATPase